MADLRITKSGELMVAGVVADTEVGVEFVDSYFLPPPDADKLYVADSGHIVIPAKHLEHLLAEAKREGLTADVDEGV